MEPEGMFSPRTATIKQLLSEEKNADGPQKEEKVTIAQQSQGMFIF